MSKHFSLVSWVARLPSMKSCIHSTRHKYYYEAYGSDGYDEYRLDQGPLYYALAEDMDGQHCPYPMLPNWAKRLFRWRLGLSLRLTRGMPSRQIGPLKVRVPTRGWNWNFHCPECNYASFYTFRRHRCGKCGWYFDEDLKPIDRLVSYWPGSTRVYMGAGEWAYRAPQHVPSGPDDIPF